MRIKYCTTGLFFLFLFTLLFTLLFTVMSPAQTVTHWSQFKHPVKFQHLSVEQGLSQSSVLCIVQDRKGFIWFGTEDGLNRYDGYRFTTFRPDTANPYSLSYNIVYALHEDRRGRLWVGTNGGGLNRFDHRLERFVRYVTIPGNPTSISDLNVNCIYEDRDGSLWIGTTLGGLNKLLPEGADDPATAVFVRYRHNPDDPGSLWDNNVTSVYRDKGGVLWIGTEGGGLNKMVPGNPVQKNSRPTFVRYRIPFVVNSPASPNNVMALGEDSHNMLWVGTQKGLYRFHRETGKTRRCMADTGDPTCLSHDYIRLIYEDRSGVLWIGTDGGGLNKMIPGRRPEDKPTFVRYRYDSNNPYCLHNNAVESIYEDRQGILWIGLFRGGVDKLRLKDDKGYYREQEQFVHYQTIPNNANSLSHNAVNAICEDPSGTLWVGTDGGGLNRITAPPGTDRPLEFRHYRYDPRNPSGLNDNIITALHADRRGILWVGTYTGGLNRREGDKFKHYRADPQTPGSLGNNFVMAIHRDRQDDLWVGTVGGGLDRWNAPDTTAGGKAEFTNFRYEAGNDNSLSDNNVMCLYEDRAQNLWVGTVGGLNHFDRNTGVITRFVHNPGDPYSLGSNFVRAIYQDSSGVLWVGTNGGGLNRLVPAASTDSASFIRYREKHGLPNDVVLGILEDDRGNLWLSTNKGLSRFNPKTGTFKNYDAKDGLQGDEFNRGAFYKSRSGEMFFGGNHGFNVFHPAGVRNNPHIPVIVLTGFRVLNRPVPIGPLPDGRIILKRSITETDAITLSHRDSVFSFEFAALHFANPSKNRFAYKMVGLEEDWNRVGSRNFVSYSTLPPGDYTFRVKGANSDGAWNETGVSIAITITPPFWKTWWFLAMVALLLLMTLLAMHLYQVRQAILKERRKYEKTHIKDEKAEEYLNTLIEFIQKEKPYLRHDLTLRKLAQMVDIPHHFLSQIINTRLNKIFFDFINQYRIEAAVEILMSQGEHKNIQQVATEVGFNSQSAFNRAFKKHTGKTPSDFINHHRIETAKEKLLDPGQKKKSIRQIAEEVGFASQTAFNRAFKLVTRQTPSQFRKTNAPKL